MVGLKSNFTILDVDDQIRVIKQLLEAEKLDEKRWPARVFAAILDGWKNRGLTPDQVPAGEAAGFANGKGKKLYLAYQERLKTLNAADFGDLLLENIRLFRASAEILRQYQQRFKFILVDEYQDTNVAQYLWLRLLAQPQTAAPSGGLILRDASLREAPQDEGEGSALRDAPQDEEKDIAAGEDLIPHPEEARSAVSKDEAEVPPRAQKNICCVGDDDQSIYGWRGAEVDNILRFDHDFPGAKIIRLERNYRSTGHILAAASHLIAHNEGRLGKTLRTEDVLGEKVQVTGGWDSEEEARSIGEEIEQLQRDARERGEDHPLDEIAILVRASFQMREFEDRFIQLGLPYRVIGGPRFYERAEIRDALAYLRVIAQPADDLAFERIVNVPKRGLGDATVQMLHDHARKQRIPLTEAAAALSATDEMKPKPRLALRDLMAGFERWRARKDSMPHTELAEIVLDESGYTAMWQADKSADAAGRLENLKELVRSMEEFENLNGFLEHIALVMDARQRRRRAGGQHHDAALGQGAGIRHRVPARLGGRPVPASTLARRERPRRAGGGAPPRPCRADAREQARQDLFRHQPAHPRAVDLDHALALSRRIAGGACRGEGAGRRQRRLRHVGLRCLAFRRDDVLRLELLDARLAARPAAQGARGFQRERPAPLRSGRRF